MSHVSILCIGDPHFTSTNQRETDALTLETSKLIGELEHKSNLPTAIIILGDTLDRHETVNLNVLARVKNFFYSILQHQVPLYVLIGNHDIPNNKLFMSEIHPFMAWSHPMLHIIDKATIISFDGYCHRFAMVPYVPPGRFEEALQSLASPLDNASCIFAHQEFKGCCYGGISSTAGDVHQLPIDVISGHIHDRQQVGRIYYPGTPYQTNMGEDTDKTISLFSWDDSTNPSYTERRFNLDIPKKITLNLDTNQIRVWTPPDSINRYRIFLHGANSDFVSLSKQGVLKNLTSKGVKVVLKDTNTNPTSVLGQIPTVRSNAPFINGLIDIVKREPDVQVRGLILNLISG